MGVHNVNHLLFYFLLLLSLRSCHEVVDIEFNREYQNLSTNGNLIPNLYLVPLDVVGPPPAVRIVVTSEQSKITNPLTLVAVKGKSILNVHLPRIQTHGGTAFEYWFTADTVCEDIPTDRQVVLVKQRYLREPVRISVASSKPVNYTLRAKPVYNFDVGFAPVSMLSSPSEPKYYRYSFKRGEERVAIKVTSDTDICGRIMAREASCPVFDAAGMVEMSKVFFYQTFTKYAYFHVKKHDIGSVFHLIFTVFPDDTECGTKPNLASNQFRIKNVTIATETAHEQSIIAILPILLYAACLLIVLLATFAHSKWLDRQENNEPNIFEGNDSEGNVMVNHVRLFERPTLTVSHKQYEKKRTVNQSRYFNFFYFQIFGAMVPSMTTLFQNRHLRFEVMNLDACNLNFPCSFEFLGFSSFNSMASASSLILLGIINLVLVFRKKIFRYPDDRNRVTTTHGLTKLDAPKVICVLSMIALGVFWTITSSCPQKTTIHLYVYTIVWVCLSAIMWIYSKRHGIRKWQQTYIIVVSSILAVFTFSEKNLENGKYEKIVMKTLLGLFANVATAFFCFKYCYERPSGLQEHQWPPSPLYFGEKVLCDEKDVYHPLQSKKVLAVLLMVWTLIWSVACPFFFPYFNQTKVILRLVQVDLLIYLVYYLAQKIRFEWKSFTIGFTLSIITFFLAFIMSIAAWGANIAFKNPSFVAWTAARSRTLNSSCIIPGVDWNDILHYNSSLICILFIFLMDYVDANLSGVPKKLIFVF